MQHQGGTPRRRRRTAAFTVVIALLLLAAVLSFYFTRPQGPAQISLYQDGVASTADGLVSLPPGAAATYLDRTRVLDPGPQATDDELALAQGETDAANAWLNSGTIPGAGTPYEEMARGALLDLRALTTSDGALVAAHYPHWDYVWPRDNSFAAAAFAATGHQPEAIAVLEFLQAVQAPDGSFEARYLTDGSGPPDDRAPQTDGTGWVLWSLNQVINHAPETERTQLLAKFHQLLTRSTAHSLALIDTADALPPISPDYWETRERSLTLGTAAPLLAGLESAAQLFPLLDAETYPTATESAFATATGSERLRSAITDHFGSQGYPRHLTGGPSDTATAFLLPPFVTEPLDGAVVAWETSVNLMNRPAGGLAPGGSWKQDGISWTPETAIYALAAAHLGMEERAHTWLTWIAEHRTASGAIPEKVLADGSPAAVAPLSWTNATVLLALLELE